MIRSSAARDRGLDSGQADQMRRPYGTIEKSFAEGLGIDAAGQKALRDRYLPRPQRVCSQSRK